MTLALAIAIPLLAVYGLFLVWYGGRGQPLSPAEIDQFMKELGAHTTDEAVLQELQTLIAGDDGKEFVMQNLVRYRPKALYPPGYDYGDDPRAADRRYGKAVIGPLLRNGSLILFIAKRIGTFIEPEGAMPGTTSRWCVTAAGATFFGSPWRPSETTSLFTNGPRWRRPMFFLSNP